MAKSTWVTTLAISVAFNLDSDGVMEADPLPRGTRVKVTFEDQAGDGDATAWVNGENFHFDVGRDELTHKTRAAAVAAKVDQDW